MIDVTSANSLVFETFILRPGGVLPNDNRMVYNIGAALIPVVYVGDLAKGLIGTCLTRPDKTTIENAEIAEMGKHVSI